MCKLPRSGSSPLKVCDLKCLRDWFIGTKFLWFEWCLGGSGSGGAVRRGGRAGSPNPPRRTSDRAGAAVHAQHGRSAVSRTVGHPAPEPPSPTILIGKYICHKNLNSVFADPEKAKIFGFGLSFPFKLARHGSGSRLQMLRV